MINADDYYGRQAFENIHSWLAGGGARTDENVQHMCMAGFILRNTLSDNGGVTRGLCRVEEDGCLKEIRETKNIIRYQEGAAIQDADGSVRIVDPDCAVSMNMWGFGCGFLDVLHDGFSRFLGSHIGAEDENTAEYLLPTIVGEMLERKEAQVSVLPTSDRWFGVTYQEDIEGVRQSIAQLVEKGVYPSALWA